LTPEKPGEAPQQQPAPAELSVDRFRAELDVFSGPLDLLLHLIKQEEVDIFEVPISRVTDRYLDAVRTMEFFDINVAAEFLVVAATLMEIKSKTLLPPEPGEADEEEDDPGMELVRRLLEYKEFREAAEELEERAEEHGRKFPRPNVELQVEKEAEDPSPEALLEDLAVWDLMAAFAEVVKETELRPTTRIIHNDVPVSAYIDEVMREVRLAAGPVPFLDFFSHERSRPRIVGIFLALLELIRQKKVRVEEVDRTFRVVPVETG
jgi:segregation and condensation protein A